MERERSASDGRVVFLSLTPEGDRRLVRAFTNLHDERRQLTEAFAHVGK